MTDPAADGDRPMALVYTLVIVTEILVLIGLWWFQHHFTH